MTTNTPLPKEPGALAQVFGHKVTRVALFITAALLITGGLLHYTAKHGGVSSGLDLRSSLVVELDAQSASKLFNPGLQPLSPKPVYVEICDANDFACKLQLKEDAILAAELKDTVTFYHLDPAINLDVYTAVYKAIVAQVGKPIPQAFPLHTLWKVGFRFNAASPQAGVGIVNLVENMTPAGGLKAWIDESLNPPADASPDAQAPSK